MIAIDTSALLAIVLREPQAEACIAALTAESHVLMSAGTMAEALIVSGRRGVESEVATLIDRLGFEIVPVTSDFAKRLAQSYARWGRGSHTAGLNFGDCFAYQVAKDHSCPLLYAGDDFSKTDVDSVL